MHIEDFRLDELSEKESFHIDHRFVFCESADCEIMHENLFGIGDELIIKTYQVVSVLSDRLAHIDCSEKSVLKESVLPQTHCSERKTQEEKDDCENSRYDETDDEDFPPVLHLNYYIVLLRLTGNLKCANFELSCVFISDGGKRHRVLMQTGRRGLRSSAQGQNHKVRGNRGREDSEAGG